MRTLLLLALAALPLSFDGAGAPLPDDPPPPPLDCPLCGGDGEVHRQVLASFARAQGQILYAYVERIL